MRLSTKLLVISELVLLLLVCVLLVPVRFQMRQQIIVDIQSRLNAIAATAALQIDGDAHGRLGPDSDPDGEDFQRVRDTLVAVRDANALTADNIYTFRLDDGGLVFGVMTQDPFIGQPYPMQAHILESLLTERPYASDLYTDSVGKWISAAAPIRDSNGRVVGVLEVNQSAEAYLTQYDYVILFNTAMALIALAIASLVGWFVLNRLVIRPVGKIHDGMLALGRQDFQHRVNIRSKDELQDLGETLNHLFEQLNVAQSIQSAFYPQHLPESSGYRLAAASEPCEATGGDYYDAFNLDDRLAILVADVTGHGLGPSLLMAACRSALHALAASGLEPGELLVRLEKLLDSDLTDGRFITMIYGVLDADGTFTYANAGHAPAMLVHDGQVIQLASHRPPLGVCVDMDFGTEQSTIKLAPGDRILLTSDGVNEAQNPQHKQYGFDRIEAIVRDGTVECQQVVTRLRNDLARHRADEPAKDDVTILCVDRV